MMYSAQRLVGALHIHVVEALRSNPGYRLVLCGHSLGAAVASLMTMLWHGTLPGIHCYAYGQACCASLALAQASRNCITSVVVGDDMVPRFGLGTALDLKCAIVRLCEDQTLFEAAPPCTPITISQFYPFATVVSPTTEALISRAFSSDEQDINARSTAVCESMLPPRDPLLAQAREVLTILRGEEMQNSKLYAPGRVLFFENTRNGNSFVEVANERFDELLLSRTMFSSHMPNVYYRALLGNEPEMQLQ
jgi:hypothetical protein